MQRLFFEFVSNFDFGILDSNNKKRGSKRRQKNAAEHRTKLKSSFLELI